MVYPHDPRGRRESDDQPRVGDAVRLEGDDNAVFVLPLACDEDTRDVVQQEIRAGGTAHLMVEDDGLTPVVNARDTLIVSDVDMIELRVGDIVCLWDGGRYVARRFVRHVWANRACMDVEGSFRRQRVAWDDVVGAVTCVQKQGTSRHLPAHLVPIA